MTERAFSLRLPEEDYQLVRQIAAEKNMRITDFMRGAVRFYLEQGGSSTRALRDDLWRRIQEVNAEMTQSGSRRENAEKLLQLWKHQTMFAADVEPAYEYACKVVTADIAASLDDKSGIHDS